MKHAPPFAAGFDSATLPMEALGHFLHGRDFSPFASSAISRGFYSAAAGLLPLRLQNWLYQKSCLSEALRPRDLHDFQAESLSEWMTSRYPKRRGPVVAIGSPNGAFVHLAAAVGMPWISQNFVLLVRHGGMDPDFPKEALERGRAVAGALLRRNPELSLYQMHDPVQDRLMTREVLYFRCKRILLGRALERFIESALEPGGTILLVDCSLRFPALRVGKRHWFQLGGKGALKPWEYYGGSSLVREFLEKEGSRVHQWDLPLPAEEVPEAEWGYDSQLTADVNSFARERGFRVQRLRFHEPEDLSPFVADLYREWYRRMGLPEEEDRLLVEPFFLVDPWCALKSRSVPFWITFNAEESLQAVRAYLSDRRFSNIRAMLMSNGVRSPRLAGPEAWEEIFRSARKGGSFIGMRPSRYPSDFGIYFRFHEELRRLGRRVPMPRPWAWAEVEEMLKQQRGAVRLVNEPRGNLKLAAPGR
jgi:hypothetical protein